MTYPTVAADIATLISSVIDNDAAEYRRALAIAHTGVTQARAEHPDDDMMARGFARNHASKVLAEEWESRLSRLIDKGARAAEPNTALMAQTLMLGWGRPVWDRVVDPHPEIAWAEARNG